MSYNTLTVISYQVAYATVCDYRKDQYTHISITRNAHDFDALDGGVHCEKRNPFVKCHSGRIINQP